MRKNESQQKPEGLEVKAMEPPPFKETKLAGLAKRTSAVRPLRPPFARSLGLVVLFLGVGSAALSLTSLHNNHLGPNAPCALPSLPCPSPVRLQCVIKMFFLRTADLLTFPTSHLLSFPLPPSAF